MYSNFSLLFLPVHGKFFRIPQLGTSIHFYSGLGDCLTLYKNTIILDFLYIHQEPLCNGDEYSNDHQHGTAQFSQWQQPGLRWPHVKQYTFGYAFVQQQFSCRYFTFKNERRRKKTTIGKSNKITLLCAVLDHRELKIRWSYRSFR